MLGSLAAYHVEVFLCDKCVKHKFNVVVLIEALARDRVTAKTTHCTYIATLFSITSVEIEEGGREGKREREREE